MVSFFASISLVGGCLLYLQKFNKKKIMKLLLLLISAVLSIGSLNAQDTTYIFEKVGDIQKTKNALYSDTKEFIADNWNDINSAIQNDDKEAGVIQIKGSMVLTVKQGMGISCAYGYNYNIKFRQKDNKYKIEIYDVVCAEAVYNGLGQSCTLPLIQPFEKDVPKTKSMGRGPSKKQATELMIALKKRCTDIISMYSNFISKEKVKVDDDF